MKDREKYDDYAVDMSLAEQTKREQGFRGDLKTDSFTTMCPGCGRAFEILLSDLQPIDADGHELADNPLLIPAAYAYSMQCGCRGFPWKCAVIYPLTFWHRIRPSELRIDIRISNGDASEETTLNMESFFQRGERTLYELGLEFFRKRRSASIRDDEGEEVNKVSDDIAAPKTIVDRDMLFEDLADVGVDEINIEYEHYYMAPWQVTCWQKAEEHSVRAKTVTRALRKLLKRIEGDA